MNTQILRTSHVSQVEGAIFFAELKKEIDGMQMAGLIPEVQYQITMQQDGKALFTALIFGRMTESDFTKHLEGIKKPEIIKEV